MKRTVYIWLIVIASIYHCSASDDYKAVILIYNDTNQKQEISYITELNLTRLEYQENGLSNLKVEKVEVGYGQSVALVSKKLPADGFLRLFIFDEMNPILAYINNKNIYGNCNINPTWGRGEKGNTVARGQKSRFYLVSASLKEVTGLPPRSDKETYSKNNGIFKKLNPSIIIEFKKLNSIIFFKGDDINLTDVFGQQVK